MNVLDGFALAIVWSKRSWTGVRFRRRHLGSGYHRRELCKEVTPSRGELTPAAVTAIQEHLLAGLLVDFKNAEGVALGVDEITLPAGFGNCELGERYDSSETEDCFGGGIEIFHFE